MRVAPPTIREWRWRLRRPPFGSQEGQLWHLPPLKQPCRARTAATTALAAPTYGYATCWRHGGGRLLSVHAHRGSLSSLLPPPHPTGLFVSQNSVMKCER